MVPIQVFLFVHIIACVLKVNAYIRSMKCIYFNIYDSFVGFFFGGGGWPKVLINTTHIRTNENIMLWVKFQQIYIHPEIRQIYWAHIG